MERDITAIALCVLWALLLPSTARAQESDDASQNAEPGEEVERTEETGEDEAEDMSQDTDAPLSSDAGESTERAEDAGEAEPVEETEQAETGDSMGQADSTEESSSEQSNERELSERRRIARRASGIVLSIFGGIFALGIVSGFAIVMPVLHEGMGMAGVGGAVGGGSLLFAISCLIPAVILFRRSRPNADTDLELTSMTSPEQTLLSGQFALMPPHGLVNP